MWSNDRPTTPGFYWCHQRGKTRIVHIWCYKNGTELFTNEGGGASIKDTLYDGTQWMAAVIPPNPQDQNESAQLAPKAVAYLDLGTGGYMDIGTDLTDEALAALPKGRHMLGIVGTYGVDGYVPAQPASSVPDGVAEALQRLIEQIEQMERQEPISYRGKVPDGWPTEEMTTAFASVFNVRDQYGTFPRAFRAALAVAPEAKAMSEFKKRFASRPRSMIEDSVKEAGISDVPFDFQIVSLEDLERFTDIISKHERDACYAIAQSQLRNMSALLSNPPKSGAAWEIACRIQARNNP